MEKYELVRLESKSVALALSDAPVAHRSHTNTKSKCAKEQVGNAERDTYAA